MPEIIDVRPAGIQIKTAFTLKEMEILLRAMSQIEVKVDWKKPEEVEAHNYLKDNFYPWVKNTVEMIKNDFGSDS